jgi:hypothetical protein
VKREDGRGANRAWTGIFGEVEIGEVFADEEEARRAGYCYDAAAYQINAFGGKEPVPWKVLGRWTDFMHKEYAKVGRPDPSSAGGGDPSTRAASVGGAAQDDKAV